MSGDKPFAWSAEACRAAMIGYAVKWPGSFADFRISLRGKWEMSDGYAALWQAQQGGSETSSRPETQVFRR